MLLALNKWNMSPSEFWELSYPMYVILIFNHYKLDPKTPMSRKTIVDQERHFNRLWGVSGAIGEI